MEYGNVLIVVNDIDIDSLINFWEKVESTVKNAIGYRGDVYITNMKKYGKRIYLFIGVKAISDEELGKLIEIVVNTAKEILAPEEVITA